MRKGLKETMIYLFSLYATGIGISSIYNTMACYINCKIIHVSRAVTVLLQSILDIYNLVYILQVLLINGYL